MNECSIAEDLLPLYNDGLLQKDTTDWLEGHLSKCSSCAQLKLLSDEPMTTENITSPVDYEKMMKKSTFKLSLYQLIFVGLSFFIALRSVVVEEDFSYILTYTILGLVTYLFYKSYKIVFLIAFIPVFLWTLGILLPGMEELSETFNYSQGEAIFNIVSGSLLTGTFMLLFSVIGATIGLFTLKLFESEGEK